MQELLRLLSLVNDPHKFAEMFRQGLSRWSEAVASPSSFMTSPFKPTEQQVIEGLVFYIAMLAITLAFYLLLAVFVGRKDLAAGARSLANAMFGLVFFLLTAMAIHFPFSWLGGQSDFWGTCLAYIYATTPYLPVLAVLMWIMVASIPADLRPYVLSPSTSQQAGALAAQSEETDKFPFYFSCFAAMILMVWNLFRLFQTLSFAHDLSGWSLAGAIVLSMLVTGLIKKLFDPIARLIIGEPQLHEPEAKPAAP